MPNYYSTQIRKHESQMRQDPTHRTLILIYKHVQECINNKNVTLNRESGR